MAAALWDTPELAATAHTALLKLRAGGVDLASDSELDVGVHSATPRSMGSESVLGSPARPRSTTVAAVTFGYRPTRNRPFTPRSLEPWGVVTFRGRWYVVGHDHDRNDTRTFRLSRIGGDVREIDVATPAERPADLDLQQIVASAVGHVDPPDSAQNAHGYGSPRGGPRGCVAAPASSPPTTSTDAVAPSPRSHSGPSKAWPVGCWVPAPTRWCSNQSELRDRVITELRALAGSR